MLAVIKRIFIMIAVLLGLVGSLVFGTLFYQGTRKPEGAPEFVALGSSFAAGLGLGSRAPDSPIACLRRSGGYPRLLAQALGVSLVDVTCSGATARHVLSGGQYFQGPQIDAVTPATRLVTLTAGGNDVDYVGDLLGMAKANQGGLGGWAAQHLLGAPHPATGRDYPKLEADLRAIIEAVRKRSPSAVIVVTTYPLILPSEGTCPALGLTDKQVRLMRPVANQLAVVTRSAARSSGAILVDIASMSLGHDACSSQAWANGATSRDGDGGPFHPTRLGAAETARRILEATRSKASATAPLHIAP